MTENYQKNYRLLGVKPGVSWKELRQAYKKLVNAWHPDRFQQNLRQKKLAEEKTKEITKSYKELAEYHKKYGVLPLPMEEETSPAGDEQIKPPPPTETSSSVRTPEAVSPSPETTALWIFKPRTRAAFTLGALGLAFVIWQFSPSEHPRPPLTGTEPVNQADNHAHDRSLADPAPTEKRITIGSSLGDVYAIQGVPTKTDADKEIWYYGSSKIYFSRGKVLHWDENIDNPLRVDISPGSDKTGQQFFRKGSSKEEVLAVQGKPDRDSGSVWDYGVSRVYFENNRVSGWHEAPFDRLKVQR